MLKLVKAYLRPCASSLAHASRPYAARSASALALSLFASLLAAAEPLVVRIAYVGDDTSAALAGARQGIAEANAQGRFLGLRYELDVLADAMTPPVARPAAIIAALDAAALITHAAKADVPVINVTSDDDALREQCRDALFHTLPSAAMRKAAEAQWRVHAPNSAAVAHAWHATLEKYAGAQLNKRYREATGEDMNDVAWAGWAAVKLVSDTIARLRTLDPQVLVTALQTDLAFDGQKGVDMSFRPNGQLRQPLLLVEAGRIVGEAPVRGVADIEDLDSLAPTSCPK